MKKNLTQGLTVFLCGTLLFTGAAYSSAKESLFGTNTTAGISHAVTLQAARTAADAKNITISGNQTAGVVDDLIVRLSDTAANLSETAEETVAEPVVYDTFGYTNLGVARTEDGNVNIREAASADSSMVGKLPNNAGCEVLGEEDGWYHISSGEVEGYVSKDFLLTGEEALIYAQGIAEDLVTVIADSVRVRADQSTDASVLSTVGRGTDLPFIEDCGEWIKVDYESGEGYVYAEYVEVTRGLTRALTLTEARYGKGISDVRVDLVNNALQYVGNPYVWGGVSLTNGADCSGFVLSIYAQYGISLPHSSSAQAQYGRRIDAAEAQPGDLFFYKRSGKGGIGHVGIYIGNGQIVHAATERVGITVSSAYFSTPLAVTSLL